MFRGTRANELSCTALCTTIISWQPKVGLMWCIQFFYQFFFNLCRRNFVPSVLLFRITNFSHGGPIRDTNTADQFRLRLIDAFKEGQFYSSSMRFYEGEGSQTSMYRKQLIKIKSAEGMFREKRDNLLVKTDIICHFRGLILCDANGINNSIN